MSELTNSNNLDFGFFRKSNVGLTHIGLREEVPLIVDVGGTGDCGFRAVAAGLIDQFLEHPRKSPEWLSSVLAKHFVYFPDHRTTLPGLVTAAERMQQMINNVRLKLIPALAFTLRQIAVTEMCEHPELYRGAFVLQNEGTAPALMRKPTTWIDESSIAALAKALSIPIEVQVVDRLKILPKPLRYHNVGGGAQPIVMRLQDGHYTPRVHHKDFFSSATAIPASVLDPVIENSQDPSIDELLAIIDAEDKRMLDAFDSIYDQLAFKVKIGDLSQDDLLTMYVKGMPNSDYLAGRVRCVTQEHGNQQFFDAVSRAQGRVSQNDVVPSGNPNQRIVDELIHAIARAISIGQMSEAVLSHADELIDSVNRRSVG